MELDKVARSVDRYGFAGISSPFLAGPNEGFQFNLDKPADYFFEQAFKPQGGVRALDAVAVDTQVALRVNIEQALETVAQFNRARSIAEVREAKRKAKIQHDMLSGVAQTLPPLPGLTPGAAPVPVQDNPLVAATLGMLDVVANQEDPDADALPEFSATTQPVETTPPFAGVERNALDAVGRTLSPGLAMPSGPFQISAREALLIASGDAMTQSLLRWTLVPGANKLNDYELFLCPVIVSVKPGWETRRGYQADVTVTVDLARQENDHLVFLSERFPESDPPIQVAGVFPAIDAQVLDLVSSRRQLYALAFQLAFLGFGSQANVFVDYARKLEQDAQTATALTVASAYTIGSTAFGFRVEPQFVALANPATFEAKPGNVLQSKTFPAMAVLLVDRAYLSRPSADDESNGACCASGKQPTEAFDYLVFRSGVRWSPVESGWAGPRRFSEVESWERARALDKAYDWIVNDHRNLFTLGEKIENDVSLAHGGKVPSKFQHQQLSSRLRSLRQLALDTQALTRVFHTRPRPEISVCDVLPANGWLDQHTVLTVRGCGFEGNVDFVTVGGRSCEFHVANDRTLLVLVPPWAQPLTAPPTNLSAFSDAVAARTPGPKQIPIKTMVAALHHVDDQPVPVPEPLLPSEEAERAALLKNLANLTPAQQTRLEKLDRRAAAYRKHADRLNLTAEVVVAARVRVKTCATCADSFPEPCSAGGAGSLGCIMFNKKITPDKKTARPNDAEIALTRDDEGRITGVKTKGGVANGAELLRLIADALNGDDSLDLDLRIQGGASMEASAKSQ